MPPQTPPIPTTPPQSHRTNYGLKSAVCLACLFFFGGLFFFSNHSATVVHEEVSDTPSTVTPTASFDRLTLEAKGIVVLDVRDNTILYARNGDIALPLASVTKLMTALVAQESMPKGAIVSIPSDALRTEGDSGLIEGESWHLDDLAAFMLVNSSNDAATALKDAYAQRVGGSFIQAMNTNAAALGMTTTTFSNEHGLDEAGKASNVGSAKDVAILLSAALKRIPETLDATRHDQMTFTSLSGTTHTVKSTNMLANDIPWSTGAKTGFTDIAGGNLAVSFDAALGRPIIIVVLGSSKEGRFSDMEKLVAATLSTLQTP